MSYVTPSELALLKTQPQRTKLYLSIYQPPTVLACRLNGSLDKGERVIPYDSVSVGSYLAVAADMTMYVGTAAGLSDKGSIRVRSIDETEITVAENSHIEWADNDYLTIVRFWQIQAVYPRIIKDPASELGTLWYKDYDIAYTNQNSVLGSFVCMGPHHAGFIEGDSAEVYYTSTGTSNLRSQTMSYEWHFEGGSPTGSTSAVPGFVSYDTPGHYTTTLTVTTVEGAEDISHRHVSIYDRPNAGTHIPLLNWELEQLSGDIQQGGYTARVRIRSDVSETLIRDGALVVIFAEDWYGNTKQSIGGNAENRSEIVFAGYILNGTIQWDYRDGYVVFDVGSPSEVMKTQTGFAISTQSSADPSESAASDDDVPSGWVVVLDMDIQRAIYHYLKWHSTALKCNDLQYTANNYQIQYFDANRDSLYSGVQTLMEGALIASAICDRQGKLWLCQDMSSEADALSIAPPANKTVFVLDNTHWMNDPIIDERTRPDVSYIEMGGVAYYGPTSGTFSALLADAPGHTPQYGGDIQRIQGLALDTQETLNALVGNIFAFQNSRYPSITLDAVGNYRNLEIAPQSMIGLTVAAEDTPRNITFSAKKFNPFSLVLNYTPQHESLTAMVSAREVTEGFAGDTIAIPPLPPTEGDDGGSVDQPPIRVPPLPPPIMPPILSSNQFVIAQFGEEDLVSDIPVNLTIKNIKTNSSGVLATIGNTAIADTAADSGAWMVSIWIYAKHSAAFTLYAGVLPCPGFTLAPSFSAVPTDTSDYRHWVHATAAQPNIDLLSKYYASKALSFPVVGGDQPILAAVKVLVPAGHDGVRVSASMVGIRLSSALPWGSICTVP